MTKTSFIGSQENLQPNHFARELHRALQWRSHCFERDTGRSVNGEFEGVADMMHGTRSHCFECHTCTSAKGEFEKVADMMQGRQFLNNILMLHDKEFAVWACSRMMGWLGYLLETGLMYLREVQAAAVPTSAGRTVPPGRSPRTPVKRPRLLSPADADKVSGKKAELECSSGSDLSASTKEQRSTKEQTFFGFIDNESTEQ